MESEAYFSYFRWLKWGPLHWPSENEVRDAGRKSDTEASGAREEGFGANKWSEGANSWVPPLAPTLSTLEHPRCRHLVSLTHSLTHQLTRWYTNVALIPESIRHPIYTPSYISLSYPTNLWLVSPITVSVLYIRMCGRGWTQENAAQIHVVSSPVRHIYRRLSWTLPLTKNEAVGNIHRNINKHIYIDNITHPSNRYYAQKNFTKKKSKGQVGIMSCHKQRRTNLFSSLFSLQYEGGYRPARLANWELGRTFQERPRHRRGTTRVIADDRGHLLPGVARSHATPWGPLAHTPAGEAKCIYIFWQYEMLMRNTGKSP